MNSTLRKQIIMRKKYITLCAAATVVGALAMPVPEVSASWFSRHHPQRAEVDHREEHQQERIATGLRNGALTSGEARQLETQEESLKRQEREEVRANGGSLTKGQTRQLNHEEDTLSREIYHDTHN
jgi:hypothetical protein